MPPKAKPPVIKRVAQDSGTSCGIACVAMLAGISFAKANRRGRQVLGTEWGTKNHRTYAGDLRKILASFDLKLGRKVKCRIWKKVPAGSLVAVQYKRKDDSWHWVVSDEDEGGIFAIDPRRSVKRDQRRDFNKIRVAWYHRVRSCKELGCRVPVSPSDSA